MEDKRIKRYRDTITKLSQENEELKKLVNICNEKGLLKLVNETVKMKNEYENLIKDNLRMQKEYQDLINEQRNLNSEYWFLNLKA